MDKPFKTHRQQLAILRNRNLTINNGSKAISLLKRDGYYNIINGYKDIFLDPALTAQYNDDRYKAGTTFEHIYALYDFDRNIRSIMLKNILKMETSLKTKIAYYFSQAYNKQSFNYLDINNFDAKDPQVATKIIADLSTVITRNTKQAQQGAQFYHYLDKHKELPLWVLVTKMTLGNTIHFYYALKLPIKYQIIDEIVSTFKKQFKTTINIPQKQQEEIISSMFDYINHFRNICAHEERMFNTIYKKSGKIPKISHFHKPTTFPFSSRVIDCILILALFLSKKEYNVLCQNIVSEINSLSTKLPSNTFNLVLIRMGFSKNWVNDLKII